ncbi:hypothetical protein DFH07DRAFT_1035803 [Mycena maculata]|uniref:Uncharacterized protein n=1 Tax=Mycena maculata TaxID=230809 RepID=A0AAD7IQQ4_9AGAR|nr:hypothetical protein DFH07DRAFT_1035803 [Mycena maculata]
MLLNSHYLIVPQALNIGPTNSRVKYIQTISLLGMAGGPSGGIHAYSVSLVHSPIMKSCFNGLCHAAPLPECERSQRKWKEQATIAGKYIHATSILQIPNAGELGNIKNRGFAIKIFGRVSLRYQGCPEGLLNSGMPGSLEHSSEEILSISVNTTPFQLGIPLRVRAHAPFEFPIGGFEFEGDDYEFVTELHAAGLADTEVTVQGILDSLTAFLGRAELQVIPVADQKTRIIAVLGPSKLADDTNEWMASDFCLLYHTLGGCSASEKWITSRNLHKHAEEMGKLLHRPSKEPRKVVLDETTPVFYALVQDVHKVFEKSLREAVAQAKANECLIVIVCAHGERVTGSLQLGDRESTMARMRSILCQAKTPTTIITTACYSGLWAVPYRRRNTSTGMVTTFAATTTPNPSYTLPASQSDCIVGGKFVSREEQFAQPVNDPEGDSARTLPALCPEDRAEKIIDLLTFRSITAASAAQEKFSDFAGAVRKNLLQARHPSSALHLASSDMNSSANTMLGLQDQVALLYRLSALKELPRLANYATLPLAVQQLEPRVLTGGADVGLVKNRGEEYFRRYCRPFDPDLTAPRDLRIAMAWRKVERLGDEARSQLLSELNVRIELDDGANRLATYIAFFGRRRTVKDSPSIRDWDEDKYSMANMANLGLFFLKLQTRFRPDWRKILGCVSGGPVYDRPAAFLACVAYDHGYTTAEGVKLVVDSYFRLHQSPSLSPACIRQSMNKSKLSRKAYHYPQ